MDAITAPNTNPVWKVKNIPVVITNSASTHISFDLRDILIHPVRVGRRRVLCHPTTGGGGILEPCLIL